MLVDLSDTINWPHTSTDHINLTQISCPNNARILQGYITYCYEITNITKNNYIDLNIITEDVNIDSVIYIDYMGYKSYGEHKDIKITSNHYDSYTDLPTQDMFTYLHIYSNTTTDDYFQKNIFPYIMEYWKPIDNSYYESLEKIQEIHNKYKGGGGVLETIKEESNKQIIETTERQEKINIFQKITKYDIVFFSIMGIIITLTALFFIDIIKDMKKEKGNKK